MSMIKGLTVLCCVALCSQNLFAQHRQMSIAELFRLADENSTEIAVYRTAAEMAEEGLKAAKAQRLPQIDISASASYIGNGYLWDRDFTNGMKVDMPHFGNNFAVEASQVIYAGGAVESGVQMADLGRRMAGLDLQKRTQDVRFLVLGHYLDLYKLNNQIRVLEHNLELTDKVIVEMHARREQGTVLKNDITRYELQKETLKLQKIRLEDAAKIINHRLVTVLHLPDSTVIVPDSTLLASEVETLTEEFWQNEAVESNLDLKQSVLNNNFNYWYVGVGIKYDLSSLFKSRQKVRQARLNLSYTVIVATCDGVTGHKNIHEGQLVQPGQTMVEIVDGTDLWVIANYRETQLRHIAEGAEVTVKADAVPGVTYRGVVGSAIYSRGLSYFMTDNIARYGAALEKTVVPDYAAAGGMMDSFMTAVTEISIKQLYGWAAYACLLLLLLFILYDAPVRRNLKLMPYWSKVRQDVMRTFRQQEQGAD